MIVEWTGWADVPRPSPEKAQLNPYVHWSLAGPGEDDLIGGSERAFAPDGEQLFLVNVKRSSDVPGTTEPPWFHDFDGLDDPLPLPPHTLEDPTNIELPPQGLPDPGRLPHVTDPDTVIAGVIDVGIPLGHWRTRKADGSTRVLAAWNMMGEFDTPVLGKAGVPFGKELFQTEINNLLMAHSAGALDGPLDELAFNIATGSAVLNQPWRYADLAMRASHGAHVLDTVAGIDPGDWRYKDEERPNGEAQAFRDKVGIIAVNAPSAATFGSGGTYLEQFLFHAIKRIVTLSDEIWKKNFGASVEESDRKGFEIVLNIAFGRQAGSKDSYDLFVRAIKRFTEERETANWAPVHFVMPVGNDNLTQSNAFLEPEPNGKEPDFLNWRVLPSDQSSNFVELWVDDTPPPGLAPDGSGPVRGLTVTPDFRAPGSDLPFPALPHLPENKMQFADLLGPPSAGQDRTIARVYAIRYLATADGDPLTTAAASPGLDAFRNRRAELKEQLATGAITDGQYRTLLRAAADDRPYYKLRFIFCVAPTYRPKRQVLRDGTGNAKADAPSGVWRLGVRNNSSGPLTCVFSVQTDQQLQAGRIVNLRSYFDEEAYEKYGEMGQALDSYSYYPPVGDNVENTETPENGPVRRHGTSLSFSANGSAVRMAGYRTSDGRPAAYSSTGRGRWSGADDNTIGAPDYEVGRTKRAPTASCPTDESPALFGLLCAGSAEGSAMAMRGTSFATSQASRILLEALVKDKALVVPGASRPTSANGFLFQRAETEDHPDRFGGRAIVNELIEKLGGGRLVGPSRQMVQRR